MTFDALTLADLVEIRHRQGCSWPEIKQEIKERF